MSSLPYRNVESTGRIFTIGDIHGCATELEVMLKYLAKKEKLRSQDLVVFVGDYIDRGPDSFGVVETIIQFSRSHPCIFLKGNHEDMLLHYLGMQGQMGESWLINGGQSALKSYGLSPVASAEEFLDKMPDSHRLFYSALERFVIIDDFIVVHAGLDPLREIDAQLDSDIYWIREEFIDSIHTFGKTVIFGHTPQAQVLFHAPYKVGIDTGLVFGNRLSVLELRDKKLLSINKGRSKVVVTDVSNRFEISVD